MRAFRRTGASARGAHGRQPVRGDEGRLAARRRRRPAAARSAEPGAAKLSDVSFSGGVSEYIYGGEAKAFGDIGPQLAAEVRERLRDWGPQLAAARCAHPRHRDRRLAIHDAGLRQHDLRVAARNAAAAQRAGDRADLPARSRRRSIPPPSPPRSRAHCSGSISATARARSRSSCRGAARRPFAGSTISAKASPTGLEAVLANGHPIVLAGDGDVGGLIGIHYCEEMKLTNPDRLDRRARAQGVRLYRYRRHSRHVGRRAGGDQVADLPDERGLGKDWQVERAGLGVPAATT